jgi:hypothetical protein
MTKDGLLCELEELGRTWGQTDGGRITCCLDKSGRAIGGADGGSINTPSQNILVAGLLAGRAWDA